MINKEALPAKSYSRPVVFFENGLGDMFINLPAIRALQYLLDNLTVLTGYATIDFLTSNGIKNCRAISIEPDPKALGKKIDLESFKAIVGKADLLIVLNPWYPSDKETEYKAFISSLTIPSLGYFDFYRHFVPYEDTRNSFDIAFDLPQYLDGSLRIEDFASAPEPDEMVKRFQEDMKAKLPAGTLLIGIQDETRPEKMWPNEKFEELINRLLKAGDNVAILILGVQSAIRSTQITDPERVIRFENPIAFRLSCGLLSLVDFFIGIDSVFLHAADLYRKPSIGLFGPTSSIEWGFRFTNGRIINSPTGLMNDIEVDEVFNSICSLIETS